MGKTPGTLAGIRYDRVHGSVANADFHVYITSDSFEAEYWPEDIEEMVYDEESMSYIPVQKTEKITGEQWDKIKEKVLSFYPELKAKEKDGFFKNLLTKIFNDPVVLDGGYSTYLCLEWKTDEGVMTEKFVLPENEKNEEMYLLLEEIIKS